MTELKPTSEISRTLYKSLPFDRVETAKVVSDRLAVLEDGTRLRLTPKGQKTVAELVFEDDLVSDMDSERCDLTKQKVISVTPYKVYGLPVYTICMVDIDVEPNKYGEYKENEVSFINECVAQDGRIFMLFEANDCEVLVREKRHAKIIQSQLFGTTAARKYPLKPIELRHAEITIKKTEYKRKTLYCIDYTCRGCSHSCGGGHCVTEKSKIQHDLDSYLKRLTTCKTAKMERRKIKVTVKDFRYEKSNLKRRVLK